MSLRVKFLLPLIAVLVLCFSLIDFVAFSTTRNVADQIVESQMTDIADSISHQIETSGEVTNTALRMMDEKNLSLANAVAAMIAEDPKYLELTEMEKLVALLGVDEVHVTDENGVLLWGNVPDFYGLDFASTEQTAALLPILENGKPIAQEPMPRGSDGVMFQYINVSRVDQKGIVQVGVSMASIDEINSTMSVQNTIRGTKIGDTGGVFVLDAGNIVTADSTSSMLGEDMSAQSWVATAAAQNDGRFTYNMDGVDYEGYHRQLNDSTIIAYMPKAETDAYATSSLAVILPIGIGSAILVLVIAIILIQWVVNKTEWYEHILDTVPMPLSVTDNHRRWTFVNRAVETIVGKKRKELLGQPCSNWNSVLCNTDQCGLDCLQKGITTTTYHENELDIKVDAANLTDHHHHTIGHVELLQDVSHIFKAQRASAMLVSNISDVSESFVAVSRQIADGAQALAQGSTEQASAVQELSASITEIAQKTRANAEMASRASHLANTIRDSAERGSAQMSEMTHAVGEINEASHNIRKVMGAIEQIAFQTNILALNASVEAARAGQHGRGFAVVAEEVRTLAAKSDEAAKETGGLITNSIEKAELGARIADETASSLTEIVRGIIESAQIVGEIASSSEEQATGIAQVNIGVDQVAQVVQKNSATAEESAAAAETMSTKSAELEDLINTFKIEEDQAEKLAKKAMEQESSAIAADDDQRRGIGGKY